ncbi:MAG: TonB-dependent receptor domain-containing protein [Thermoanaerobaculaceae bacterium]
MRRLLLSMLVLALALPAMAQNPTGTLTGTVSDAQGPLPGVTVTITSPSLQGVRTAVTGVDGDYIFKFLPPGEYRARFELAGFQTLDTTVKISAAVTSPLNATMPQATVAEEVTVTGSYETISANQQASTTLEASLIDKLPVNRTIAGAIALAPTVTTNGPGNNITIAGAQSYESLYLVNGVVVNENLRGQALPLFIEDAIEETTATTSGVSAEYGRFAGGVVNTLTKSGGNEFRGSFRTSFTNDDWAALRPGEVEPVDKINQVYEATLGGYLLRDHIWFFAAGRDTGETKNTFQTGITNLRYDSVNSQQRYEGKGTFALNANHRVIGSYIEIKQKTTNGSYPNAATIMDLASLSDREDPQTLVSANYTGVISDNFFLEGQYSKRDFTIAKGSGAKATDRVFGTLLRDQSRSNRRFWTPTFCGVCGDETRNNEDYILKASYFLGTDKLGSHDIVFGYDEFSDLMKQNNHQSGSDFRVLVSGAYIGSDGTITPIVRPRGQTRGTYLQWWPIFELSKGADFTTKSVFLNDRWRFNNNWSFNVGVRYDKNDGTNQMGATVAKDSRFSPRLGVTFDPAGDGRLIFTASLAQYVTAIANGVGDSTSSAGSPSYYEWWYTGPEINTDPNNTVPTDEVLRRIWAWFDSVGGTNNSTLYRNPPDIAGSTTQIRGSLDSPYANEIAVGATKRLGATGMVRVDYMHREFKDLYTLKTDMTTGTVELPSGDDANVNLVVNSNVTERQFDAVTVQGQLRQGVFNLGGSYTWSQTIGNTIGEYQTSGPVADTLLQYPEYIQLRWNSPRGYLPTDQRHSVRLWGVVDILSTKHNRLSAGFLQQFNSGTPYEAQGVVDSTPYVQNPGYVQPPDQSVYFYSKRGAYRTDDIWRTDLTLNYSFVIPAWSRQIELYLSPEVLNVFNQQGVINVDTTVEDNTTHPDELQAFNPFTEKPVEGVHWRKGADFGKPLAPADYQLPRTFRFSVGIRF